jgi:predicted HTH transcriptional regulator
VNCEALKKILLQGEDSIHQFKLNFNSIDKLASEICAFANSQGGYIIIGVSDNGELAGLELSDISRLNQWISNATSQKIDKMILVQTQILICDNKRILIIHIPQGSHKPYAVNRTDVWVKCGADKRKAPIDEILRLAHSSGMYFADEIETSANIESFDRSFFNDRYKDYYEDELQYLQIPLENLLQNLKVFKNNKLTLAGLLLFGKNPERTLPQFTVKATSYQGNEKADQFFKDKEDIGGKLSEQYMQSLHFIDRNLHRIQTTDDFNDPGTIEIPQKVFSEIIANAIIHRNYYIQAPIQIHLFADRLVIESPGTLPNTLTEENIRVGVHVEINPTILSLLAKDKHFKYSGRGTGIPRVIKLCKQEGIGIRFVNDLQIQRFCVIINRRIRNE